MTVLEKAVVFIAFMAIAVAVVYFINPQKKMLEMRNSNRRGDVSEILNAVYQYSSDNGTLPFQLTSTPVMICKSGVTSCGSQVDISKIAAAEKNILSSVPTDPKEKDPNASGYQISKTVSGRINISAPLAEGGAVISLSK